MESNFHTAAKNLNYVDLRPKENEVKVSTAFSRNFLFDCLKTT